MQPQEMGGHPRSGFQMSPPHVRDPVETRQRRFGPVYPSPWLRNRGDYPLGRSPNGRQTPGVGSLENCTHTLAHGFKALEASVLAGHLDFALLATTGKASKSFARVIYDGVVGSSAEQPAPVYRALQWLEAIMQKPPSRV